MDSLLWWTSWILVYKSIMATTVNNTINKNTKQIIYDDPYVPAWRFLLYCIFQRWGVILCGFNAVSCFPLKIFFSVVLYLWFLERKCLYSSNTSFLKLFERRYFILGPQTRCANFPFIWRPTINRYGISMSIIIIYKLY